ncbi:cytochrome b-c1 complex subunit 10 [Ischnura elegans]|uniref:cytochrome b-c1 complex subunit 10 n=1 Tax=Ischnura elegans TaxID=197161 RepID=UPI001ED8773D|nr:cytochrome b-c1 complex subunit 10 [Ischnura elegans]XP_046398887.1 cytochrome b-c1 complex subunit 10 [Ischnura elegans]
MAGIGSKMNLPGPLRIIGKKHIEQAGQWVPSLVGYGTAAFCGLLYFTDWKAVMKYVPYYNIPFKNEGEEK